MKRVLLTSVLAVAACTAPALAEDFVGTVELEGKLVDVKNNKSKFTEYKDIGKGATGSLMLDWSNDKGYFLNLVGENFGYNTDTRKTTKDQQFFFSGGLQESYKYSVFYKETPHNLTLGARSSFTNVGSAALQSTLASTANSTATVTAANIAQYYNKPTFDYTIDRKDYGAEADFSFKSPFFFNARYEHNQTQGLLPIGTSLSGQKELPAPINYKSDNFYLTTGYRSNDLIVTLDGTISDFSNATSSFTYHYTNTTIAGQPAQRTYLPPNSMNYKVGGNVMYRLPFWSTTVMARASHSISDNTIGLTDEVGATNSINGTFKGKLTYTTVSAAITSSPIKAMDVKLYLNVLDKKNQSSDPFRYHTGAFNAATGLTEKFAYNKLNGGLDVGYKLPAKTKLSAGYEYLRINRSMIAPDPANTGTWGVRTDAPQTTDHILYAQVKNNLLDWMSAKLRYQRLFRESDFRGDLFATFTNDNRYIKAFWRPSDTANKTQDSVKIALDLEPLDALSVGLEYTLKYDKYTDSVLGMQDDTRHEFYLDANYRIAMVKLNPYAELELVENNSKHRRYQTAGAASPFSAVNDATNFNWTSKRKDVNYAFGLNADIDIIKDKLLLTSGYRYERAEGTEDFTTSFLLAAPAATPLISNLSVDSYTKQTFSARLKYNITKSLHVGLGYLFENLRYADDHYNNYSYLTTSVTGSGTQITGAYADPNYDAHVGYMSVGYTF